MSTLPKTRKGKGKITNHVLSQIDELRHFDSMTPSKIAGYLNLSDSTTSRYIRILEAIENETDFNVAGDLNWRAIKNFCNMNGKPVPKNIHYAEPEQISIDSEEITSRVKEAQPTLSDMLESIAFAFSALAEYLNNLIKEEKQ